jgi:hypothetical protein
MYKAMRDGALVSESRTFLGVDELLPKLLVGYSVTAQFICEPECEPI